MSKLTIRHPLVDHQLTVATKQLQEEISSGTFSQTVYKWTIHAINEYVKARCVNESTLLNGVLFEDGQLKIYFRNEVVFETKGSDVGGLYKILDESVSKPTDRVKRYKYVTLAEAMVIFTEKYRQIIDAYAVMECGGNDILKGME